jgi:diguanylate cyclase (GGDEF)-like protein
MPDEPDKTAEYAVVPLETEPAPPTVPAVEPVEHISGSMPSTERSLPEPASLHRDRATLTLLTGVDAGQAFALDRQATVLGRDPSADIRFEDAAVSRHHARIWRSSDGRYTVEDLKSANGTFVGTRRVSESELRSSDGLQLGPHVLLRFALVDATEEELQRRLFESSTRDGLTRVYNRKYLMDRLAAECAHARRHRSELSAIMFDLDHFKQLNDENGHLAGDAVLCAVATCLASLIRLEDMLARYGGEEFAILARSTSREDAMRLADRARAAVAALAVRTAKGTLGVTVSAGVAAFAELGPKAEPEELLARADARLYRAKKDGRNCTCGEG